MYWLPVIAIGLCLGSFATVLTARVATGESVVAPRSACRTCSTPLRWFELVPVASYLLLRGKCRSCAARIGVAYPLIELATMTLFWFAWWREGPSFVGLALAGLAVIGPPLAVIDLREQRLPNALTGAGGLWMLGCAVADAVMSQQRYRLLISLICGLSAALLLFMLAIVSRGGMGMGDVKLAGVIGMATGLVGWMTMAAAIGWAFVLGAGIGVALMAVGRAGRRTALAFGPMLIAGAWLALLTGVNPLLFFGASIGV